MIIKLDTFLFSKKLSERINQIILFKDIKSCRHPFLKHLEERIHLMVHKKNPNIQDYILDKKIKYNKIK